MSLWSELKRRRVLNVAAAYAVVGLAVGEGADIFLPQLGAPDWVVPVILGMLVLGFPLALVLAWAYDVTPEGVVRTAPVAASSGASSGAAVVEEEPPLAEKPASAQTSTADVAPTPPPPPSDRLSIAVLPLTNLSDDPESEYFSDGMTDDILTALSFIENLKVISRTSVMRYKGTTKTIREIAGELGVGTVVEGSVRRAGGRVRIVTQLIDASTDEHLWADTYDRELEDVFAVQSEVAEAIAGALESVLSPQGKARLATKPTDNLEAYELVLRGRHEYVQYLPAPVERGMQFLRQAIELDPGYALAHAHLGLAYFSQPYWSPVAPDQIREPAKEAIDRAFEFDPNLPEAYTARAFWKANFEWDWEGADADLVRAIELNPNLTDALGWRSLFLQLQQRTQEALQDARRGVALDPLSQFSQERLANVLVWSGEVEAARIVNESILDVDRGSVMAHFNLGMINRPTDPAAALEHYDLALETLDAPLVRAARSFALRYLGRGEEADQIIADLEARSQLEFVSPFTMGMAYLGAGDLDRTFDFLEEGAEIHDFLTTFIRVVAPAWGIADHPRFLALRSRIWPDEFGGSPQSG